MTTTLYEDLMEGFEEILDAQKTGKKMKSGTITIPDVPRHYAKELKTKTEQGLRKQSGLK